ncbi:hypothetical protein [Sphaerisporangium perillae]|uniref:hypothetical protein n=1 Tax=Sphaerisporangium perillae TaxID=2935860 RepID=UPI00200E629E|nr:hypothetical protein [Sphaerisporangium perillae]
MTPLDVLRRAALPLSLAAGLAAMTACSATNGTASGAGTSSVAVSPAPSGGGPAATPPAGTSSPAPPGGPSTKPFRPAAHPSYPAPKIFGTEFQADPGHDFTKHVSPRSNGVLRGMIRALTGEDVVEYVPVKWVKGVNTEGYFEGPPEGDATVYAAPIAGDVVFLSATGCEGMDATVDDWGLGNARCSRAALIAKARTGGRAALITTESGRIVKVVEIFTP